MSDQKILKRFSIAYKLRQSYPDLLIGIDISGDENKFRRFRDLAKPILQAQENAKKSYPGVTLPLVLHCGESVLQENENPIDGIMLKSVRMGHAIDFIKFPYLLQECVDKKICFEIQPISNQCLKQVRDLKLHPAITYAWMGIPLAVSGDDPTIYGSKGVTYDLFAALTCFEWKLKDLKLIFMNSINYSLCEESQKELMKKEFSEKWQGVIKKLLELSGDKK